MEVTDVLRDRSHAPTGLRQMVTISLAAHLAAVTLVILAPGRWARSPIERPHNAMTITIGGAGEGPRNGGMTPAAAQPVQVATPPEVNPKREAVRPPAAATPEMVVPTKAKPTKTAPTARPVVRQAPDQARGTTPTRGAQVTAGSALANTGPRGQGFGLSTGGGAGTGSFLDVADFCCPDYIVTMVDRIRSIWAQNQGATGQVVIKFTILRTGQIAPEATSIEQRSGVTALDLAALRAVLMTRSLPPLPDAFPNPTLTVHLSFQYR